MKQKDNTITDVSKMKCFLDTRHDAFGKLALAFRYSMADSESLASTLWIEDGVIRMDHYLTDAEALAEVQKHEEAIAIPRNWHEKLECDWIWVEEDEYPDSDSYGEDLWCCTCAEGTTARCHSMKEMWNTVLDYIDNDWLYEAGRVINKWEKGGAE